MLKQIDNKRDKTKIIVLPELYAHHIQYDLLLDTFRTFSIDLILYKYNLRHPAAPSLPPAAAPRTSRRLTPTPPCASHEPAQGLTDSFMPHLLQQRGLCPFVLRRASA